MDSRRTFAADDTLPSMPLPELRHTLDRYLDSLRPFTTDREFAASVKIAEDFAAGVGRRLNDKLAAKASAERNWVEKWWEEYAYLQYRSPLLPFSSMVGVPPRIRGLSYGCQVDQVKNMAVVAYVTVGFWQSLRREEFPPAMLRDGRSFLSMSQYRRLYNTVRVPGDKMDALETRFKTEEEGPCPSNVIVMSRGRIFDMDGLAEDGSLVTPPEWEERFWRILRICDAEGEGHNVGVLTCDDRTKWSKNRKRLQEKNGESLEAVERSILAFVLDAETPSSVDDVLERSLCGDYNNRWADKSISLVFFRDGLYGMVCDHTAMDGICSVTSVIRGVDAAEKYVASGAPVQTTQRELAPPPRELIFDLDNALRAEVRRVQRESAKNRKQTRLVRVAFEDFGKTYAKEMAFNPDTFVQMALQLAYLRLHGKPAPCYETASTRAYYNGRTETLRACTKECVAWARSMLDGSGVARKAELLKAAAKRHDELMREASNNAGCDRHLFGLYLTAMEEGIKVPKLYVDPAYSKSGGNGNFILSTSCIGYSEMSGAVAPMSVDCYGVFYNILPDRIKFAISVNTKSRVTDVGRFFDSLKTSLRDMKHVLASSRRSASKL